LCLFLEKFNHFSPKFHAQAQGEFERFPKGTFLAVGYAKGLLCSDGVLRQSHRLQREGTTLGSFIRGINVRLRKSRHSASKRWTAMGASWNPGRASVEQTYRIF
jgi:hypothetical protein